MKNMRERSARRPVSYLLAFLALAVIVLIPVAAYASDAYEDQAGTALEVADETQSFVGTAQPIELAGVSEDVGTVANVGISDADEAYSDRPAGLSIMPDWITPMRSFKETLGESAPAEETLSADGGLSPQSYFDGKTVASMQTSTFGAGETWYTGAAFPVGATMYTVHYFFTDGTDSYLNGFCYNFGMADPRDRQTTGKIPPSTAVANILGQFSTRNNIYRSRYFSGTEYSTAEIDMTMAFATQMAIWQCAADEGRNSKAFDLYSLSPVAEDDHDLAEQQIALAIARDLYEHRGADTRYPYFDMTAPASDDHTVLDDGTIRFDSPWTIYNDTDFAPSFFHLTLTVTGLPEGGSIVDDKGNRYANGMNTPDDTATSFYAVIPSDAASGMIDMRMDYQTENLAPMVFVNDSGVQDVAGFDADLSLISGSRSGTFSWSNVTVEKTDAESKSPVADTEFSLTDPSGTVVATVTTDEDGKAIFSCLTESGTYTLTETRPNPRYASAEESGTEPSSNLQLTAGTQTEVQVFEDDLIQLSCEVYKHTIDVTSAALDTAQSNLGSNVGAEEYLYTLGARSTSNVKADEFAFTDPLELVEAYGMRVTKLWTGTASGDFDGKCAVLYQTNKNARDVPTALSANMLSSSYANPNNPDGNTTWTYEDGWLVWDDDASTDKRELLSVADLGLAKDEYITAIRVVFGDVDKGFYTGSQWTMDEDDIWYNESYAENDTKDWIIAVVASKALAPYDDAGNETVIPNSVKADIARNWSDAGGYAVLTDEAIDQVETRVIDSFMVTGTTTQRQGSWSGLPMTGDTTMLYVILGFGVIVIAIVIIRLGRRSRKE